MNSQNTQWDTLREEFYRWHNNNGYSTIDNSKAIADWWLSKLKEDRAGLIEKVEGMKMTMRAANKTGSEAGAGYTIGHNAALDAVLAILKS